MATTQQLVDTIIEGIHEKKGRSVVTVNLQKIDTAPCAYFVLCTGGSPQQVQALAQEVGEQLLENDGLRPTAVDGMRNAQWVAMDYGDVIVHILLPDAREFYDIEHLWEDADITEIPNLD